MTELLKPTGDFDIHRSHRNEDNDQLPTPLLTPLIGSPLLQTFATVKEEPLYESLEQRLSASNGTRNAPGRKEIETTVLEVDENKDLSQSQRNGESGRARAVSDRLATPGLPGGSERLDKVLKLSPQELKELTLDPDALPIRRTTPSPELDLEQPFSAPPYPKQMSEEAKKDKATWEKWSQEETSRGRPTANRTRRHGSFMTGRPKEDIKDDEPKQERTFDVSLQRPVMPVRTASTPPNIRRKTLSRASSSKDTTLSHRRVDRPMLSPLDIKESKEEIRHDRMNGHAKPSNATPTPMASSAFLPIPPLSIPTFLQLELDAEPPSQLYIQRSAGSEIPYESSAVKFERLENFLLLPGHLEGTLLFGAAACFDAWLYTMTILPLRFSRALAILIEWWARNTWKELCDIVDFVYRGIGRLWRRKRSGSAPPGSSTPSIPPMSRRSSNTADFAPLPQARKDVRSEPNSATLNGWPEQPKRSHRSSNPIRRHRRTRSTPSLLMPNHKADLLKGFLIISASLLLLYLDPSRMYHNIRGQSAIKLYVIYNMLEVADKLLGSIGQDILECLFSRETLERKPDGRSKVLRPFWLFMLSLVYNVIHASALFYQVITLNVAVNSYSNALLTLLMSNQFVEIKGAVFKKFEKENLFQMCCADVVERFQLLLMLMIIAMRNIVEVGGISISLSSPPIASPTNTGPDPGNATGTPFSSSAILPKSFNILPTFPGKVLTPFLIVVCSEMLVDWLKYAYINKFNNFKPHIFGRFYDVLAKDYYTHAFGDQNLTRRIGLPVFPLTCLFIRASVQTYHMLVATALPSPVASPITSLALEEELPTSTPSTMAALAHIDKLFRRALGRSGFEGASTPFSWFNFDDFTAMLTTTLLILVIYLLLLAFKLVWGMFLLALARRRYMSMRLREQENVDADGKRKGGWAVVEVGEDRRKVIYEDDEDGLRKMRDRDRRGNDGKGKEVDYGRVKRYDMVAKRIW